MLGWDRQELATENVLGGPTVIVPSIGLEEFLVTEALRISNLNRTARSEGLLRASSL